MKLFALLGMVLCLVIAGGVWTLLRQIQFGGTPDPAQPLLTASPHYTQGIFHNEEPTPVLREGESTVKILLHGLISPQPDCRPIQPLPVDKIDIRALPVEEDVVVWLGHSSLYIQIGGKRLLIDPVFSAYGAPFSFLNTAFSGTTVYKAADLPPLDYLLITHDHWDHLDYATVQALRPLVGQALVPLGVGAHMRRWGWPEDAVREMDWNTRLSASDSLTIYMVPARHYSGRGLTHNQTLWAGFVLESPHSRVFVSGDTGYGKHIAQLAQQFGSFDLVALDCGQYDARWPYIHMTPEEAAKAAEALHTRLFLPIHAGRFALAQHAWDAPLRRALTASAERPFALVTPRIGGAVFLHRPQHFPHWWE